MLKNKCFIIGGMILSSSLQAVPSAIVDETGRDPEKLARTEKGISEAEKQLAELARLREKNDLELKVLKKKEKAELKRKVEMHEAEIQRLKNQLKRIDYMLEDIRKEQILNRPSLRQQLEL